MTVRGRTTPNSEFDGLDPIEKAAVERALSVAPSRPKLRANSVTRGASTSTSCCWQTFAPPLRRLPMSSERKAGGRPRPHVLPW